jgi:hypothetical protein
LRSRDEAGVLEKFQNIIFLCLHNVFEA